MTLLRDTNQNQGDRWNSSALSYQIIKCSFVVSRSGRHFGLDRFHGQDFDAAIDAVTDEKGEMLYEEIADDEGILSQLDLDRDAVFDEVGLIVGAGGLFAFLHKKFVLGIRRHGQGFAHQPGVVRNPILDAGFRPTLRFEVLFELLIEGGRVVEKFADHSFFLADLGSALFGIDRCDSAFDFLPKTGPPNLQPLVAVEVGVKGFDFQGAENSPTGLKWGLDKMALAAQRMLF